jgi:prevent-host-death family protein
MTAEASVRELKNQTTALLRQVEQGTRVVVTRRGRPVATLKPFEERDLHPRERYPTSLYQALQGHIEAQHPEITRRTAQESERDFERISRKARKALPFKDWQEMDRALKGDRYGLTRQ